MGFSEGSRQPLLVIAYYFPPENTSGAARPYRFYKYLPNYGVPVSVITSSEQDASGAPEGVHFIPGIRDCDIRTITGFTEGALRKYFISGCENVTWILPAIKAAKRIAPPQGFRAVLSTSPPVTPHIVGMRIARSLGIPWIADFRDPILGNPFVKLDQWHLQVDELTEPFLFSRADLLIANTEIVEREWHARYPQYRDKIRVLWNGFDPEEEVGPMPLPVRDHRLLIHTGNLYGKRHPGSLLASLDRLVSRGELDPSSVRVKFVGGLDEGSMPAPMNAFDRLLQHRMLEYDNVTVPRIEALRLIGESDYLLLVDVQDPTAGRQIPAKLFDYLRVGRPILALTTRGSATDVVLSRAGVPYVAVYVGDTDECVDAKVRQFLRTPTDAVEASEWFTSSFDGRLQTGLLAEMIAGLKSGARRRAG